MLELVETRKTFKVPKSVTNLLRVVKPSKTEQAMQKEFHKHNVSLMEQDQENVFSRLYEHVEKYEPLKGHEKYGFRKVYSKKRRKEIKKIAKSFHDICRKNPNLFNYTQDYKVSIYLTAIGFKPSCLLDKYLAQTIIDLKNPIFKDFTYLKLNHDTVLFYNPTNVTKVIKKYPEVFEELKPGEDIALYLKELNISNYETKPIKEQNKGNYYMKHLAEGLLLGYPYPNSVKFAAYQSYLDNYMSCYDPGYNLSKLSNSFQFDIFDEAPEDPLFIIRENYAMLRNPVLLEEKRKAREEKIMAKVPTEFPNKEIAKVLSSLRIIRLSSPDLWLNAYGIGSINRDYVRQVYRFTKQMERMR